MHIELRIDPDVCVTCGICVESCPIDVITYSPHASSPAPTYVEDCQACFLCVFDCPVDAISLRQRRVAMEEIGVKWLAQSGRVSEAQDVS